MAFNPNFQKKKKAVPEYDPLQQSVYESIKPNVRNPEVQQRTIKRQGVELIEIKQDAGTPVTQAALREVTNARNRPRDLDHFVSAEIVGTLVPNKELEGRKDVITMELQRWLPQSGYDMFVPAFPYYGCERDMLAVWSNRCMELAIITSAAEWLQEFNKVINFGGVPINKHSFMRDGRDVTNVCCLVIPEGFVALSDIPPYLGVITVAKGIKGYLEFKIAVPPPPIQVRFLTIETYQRLTRHLFSLYQSSLYAAIGKDTGENTAVKKESASRIKPKRTANRPAAPAPKRASGKSVPAHSSRKAAPTGKVHALGKNAVSDRKKQSTGSKPVPKRKTPGTKKLQPVQVLPARGRKKNKPGTTR